MSVRRTLALLAAAACASLACTTAKVAPVEPTAGRDPDGWAENHLWVAADRQLEALRDSGAVVDDPALASYLNGLVADLVGAPRDALGPLQVLAVADSAPNAAAFPQGSLLVTTGLLGLLENEAELAAVLCHEIAHYTRRHGYQSALDYESRSTVGKVLGGLFFGLILAAGAPTPIAVVDQTAAAWVSLTTIGYASDLEREADAVGFERFAAHGYEHSAAASVFRKLASESPDPETHYSPWNTHPALSERIASAEAAAAALPPDAVATRGADPIAYRRGVAPALIVDARMRIAERGCESARARIHALIEALPAGPDGYSLLGRCERSLHPDGPYDDAIRAYLQALAVDPAHAPAFRDLGLIYVRQGRLPEAIAALRTYTELAPDSPDAQRIDARRRRLEDALEARKARR